MKIRLKDSYDGPIPKDVLHEALRGKNAGYDCYVITFENSIWYIHINSVEEVDEFEEEFSKLCTVNDDGSISIPRTDFLVNCVKLGSINDIVHFKIGDMVHTDFCDKKDIPALILALLKLMDE